ncbi:MAG: hypothetical protein M3Q45_12545 [Chloroflexota bacterium]|nr:hypothetical protein [Chloroflexota bacterium]
MLIAVETIIQAMVFVVQVTPVGTNIGLVRIMWAMCNGSFLQSRGALHGALVESGFAVEEIRRSWSAMAYGSWTIAELLISWGQQVASRNQWRVRRYAGYRVKSVDITAFWRPCLAGEVSQHYNSIAQKALPAIVFGVMSIAGAIRAKRLPLLTAIVRCPADSSQTDFRQQLLKAAVERSGLDEVLVMDAGFTLPELQAANAKRFVLRLAKNCTARRNHLPERKQRGRPQAAGELIRPLARTHQQKQIPATLIADATGEFVYNGRTIGYRAWHQLVTSTTKVAPMNQTYAIYVYHDPLYTNPLLLATDLALTAEAVYLVYLDRWPVEHPPLAAKQMIGLHRQFVFAEQARYRLSELALLAGNILAHVAAQLPPLPTGFWDRIPQPTPGRLRRVLGRALFPNLLEVDPQLRKKNSVTDHLPKGVAAHRRHKRTP